MASNQTFTLNIKALFDASDVKSKVGDIQNALKNIKLPDTLKRSLDTSFVGVNKALDDFNSKVAKGVKTKSDATGITRSFDSVTKELNNLDKLLLKVKEELGDGVDLSKIIQIDNSTKTKIEQLKNEISDLQKKISSLTTDKLDELKEKLNKITSPAASKGATQAFQLFEEGKVQEAIQLLDQVIAKQEQVKSALEAKGSNTTNVATNIEQLRLMKETMESVLPSVQEYTTQIGEKATQASNLLNSAQQKTAQSAKDLADGFHAEVLGAEEAERKIEELTTEQANFNKEVDQIKSKIQYFFGLSNAINLVKRAIRGAFDTIKELDKAMTETAVVTDFSVSDMWAQLPEYTKRANELGVTTLAAYQAATLYYQQGLKTNEVNALSVETLKMARIAGLDAAEATDRMTNALRGFNMELTTANAQRVDDVYSELAANTASNVDEISTAMTKVASLAHNANMEFETTAAFLAQIIETTRESAETAGTALKTVVARFTEVKKLVDEGTLRGQDEEGQIIDVNKVSAALRTAGIDMNKYFLGEVGLDDIFMELASKWDNLTALQQRYIATQAAGSRQQSRFIALMSDYARTQKLVGKAYNANGAAARQFEKTQESLESKLARLKNAWNEFLMGLTNNVVVKGAVDLLTDLLNFVNKLTSGFDATTNSALKFTAALAGFAGLKFLAKSKGPLDTLLGTLLQGTMLGNGLVNGNILSGKVLGGVIPGSKAAKDASAAASGAVQTPLIFGSGSLLFKAGKRLWSGAKNLGTFTTGAGTIMGGGFGQWGVGAGLSGSAGVAAGLTGIATALIAVAAAAGTAYGAYKLWEKYTPEGQLKVAKKRAEAAEKEAKDAEKAAKSIQSLSDSYKEYSASVNNATTIEERQNAIQNRNQAILDAINESKDYAQYVDIGRDLNGELVLTLNEEKVTEAAIEAAKEATRTAIESYFAQGYTDYKAAQAEEARRNITETYQRQQGNLNNPLLFSDPSAQIGAWIGNALGQLLFGNTPEEQAKSAIQQQQYLESSRKQIELAYATMLDSLDVKPDADLSSSLSKTLSEIFIQTGKQLDTTTVESLITGLTSGNIDKNILSTAVADSLDFSLLDVDLDSTEGFDNFLSQLGITEDELTTFSEAIGDDTGAIQNVLKARAKELQAIQKNQKEAWQRVNTQTAGQVIQLGGNLGWSDNQIASSIADILSLESFDEQLAISDLLSSIDNSELAATVLDNLDNSGLREWIANLDFSNPINGLLQLQDAAKNGEGEIQKLGESLQETSSFSTSSLLTYFTQSSDYKSLTESLADFIDENGKISSSNIIELAKSNKTLNDLLKTGAISAKALAQALTGIETGKIQTWDLNDAIIDALNSMDDLDGMVKRTIDDLNSFDPGYDENDVTDFINKVVENATSNIEKGAWGNNQMRNYMEYIFGSYKGAPGDEYTAWLQNGLNWLNANKDNMKSAWADIAYASEKAARDSGKAIPIWQENGEIVIDISQYTTDELVAHLQEQTKTAEGQITLTEQQIRMMIADYKNYSDDFALTLERNDLKDVVSVWAQEAGAQGWYLDKDLQTLATALGVDVDEINKILGELNPDLVKIDLGDGSPEDILGAIAKIQGVGGNVDLANRPSIDTSKLKAAGWLEAGEGTATVYSSTFSNENGTIAANFTPILPNGEVLSPTELQNYAESVISGAQTDDLKLQIGSSFNGDDAIEQAEQAAESIHQIQGLLYTDDLIDWNGIKQAFSDSGLVEYFDSTMNQMLEVGDSFTADFGRGLETVTINAGETATKAYARAAEESARAALADDIGEAVANALGKIEINASTEEAQAAIDELFGNLKTEYETANTYSTSINISTDTAVQNIRNLALAYSGLARSIQAAATAGSSGAGGVSGTSSASRARGGYVSSYGSGSYRVEPGIALTGEEDPEIVWNKEKGYAYITGKNGPEFQNLQPGDRVFNAQETKKILRNSSVAKGGIVPSYASRPVHGYGGVTTGGGSGGSGSDSDKYQKQSTWRNELDWLYDLMEDIAEYERQQNIIQTRNELALEDIASSGRDLYKLTREELINLETQLDGQQAAQLKRLQQMGELQTQVNAAGYGRYMQWNQQDRTLEIDWDAIEAIQDKETYDEVVDWLNRMESVQDQIDDAEDAMWDIKKQIQELQERYLQKYLDFQNRVLDAIVKQYQDQIDKLSEINDNVNDTNASILDSIQREIDLERQIRDNTDAESNIADMEARLAYLQRDTTGANATEIRQLQKQLDEARTSYGDTLIDQAADRLAQSNEDAAAQREKQIELMQAQLDYWQESGGLWSEVEQLISTGFNGNGSLIRGSDLEKVLQNAENYEAMSQAQRDNWANELILETNQVGAHILELANGMNVNAEQIRALLTNLTGRLGGTPQHSYTAEKAEEKYATGGLNTYTGLAHLDGTPSAPEYVLNPEQTNAFLRLADVLPSIMGGDSIGGTTYGGDIYLNLSMHVDEIASDYDVDRIADRVKDILYDASSYRNVNTLNFIR